MKLVMKMICRNCGREIDDDSSFCRYCGAPVDQYSQNNYQGYDQQFDNSQDIYFENPDKKKKNRIVWIILAAVLVVVAVYQQLNTEVAEDDYSYLDDYNNDYYDNSLPDESQVTETTFEADIEEADDVASRANALNGGFVASFEDGFYYIDSDYSVVYSDNQCIDLVTVIDDSTRYLLAYNDTLIYVDDTDGYVYSYDRTTMESTLLIETDTYYPIIEGDKLYYQNDPDSESIYCLDLISDETTKLNDEASYYLSIEDSYLYYYNGEAVKRINLDSLDIETILDKKVSECFVADEYLYYIDYEDYQLYCYDMENNSETALVEKTIYEYTMNEDQIVMLIYESSSYYIATYDLESQELTSYDVIGLDLQILGDYLYYIDTSGNVYLLNLENYQTMPLTAQEEGQFV